MSQNDLSIANQGFASFRSDLNSALQALGSTNSGTSAPSTTYANQLFYDTTNNILKIRNEDNDAFISLFTLDQTNDNIESLTINGALSAESLDLNGGELILDSDGDTSITADTDDTIDIKIAGSDVYQITATKIDLNGKELVLDADGDTSITSDTDDRVDIKVAGSDVVHVTSTGLGIGDTSPSFKLSVNGNVGISQGSTLFFINDSGFSPSITNSGTVTDMIFNTNNSESMRISSGRLLINTTATLIDTDQILQVSGSQACNMRATIAGTGGSVLNLERSANSQGDFIRLFNSSGSETGQIRVDSGGTTQFENVSDYRLKNNIKDWDVDASAKVKQVKIKTFDWKDQTAQTNGKGLVGVIAHELQEVYPHCVSGEKDGYGGDVDKDGNKKPMYQGVDYGKLTPLLTKALQEAIAKIETLEAKVTALESK